MHNHRPIAALYMATARRGNARCCAFIGIPTSLLRFLDLIGEHWHLPFGRAREKQPAQLGRPSFEKWKWHREM